jgi:hypothetical protein
MCTRTDYEAVNARGLTLATFGDADLARAWVRDNASTHPGLRVEEVIVTTVRRRLYQPRPQLRAVA